MWPKIMLMVKEGYGDIYYQEKVKMDLLRGKILAGLLALFEIGMIILLFLKNPAGLPALQRCYLFMYVLFLIVMILFLFSFYEVGKHRLYRRWVCEALRISFLNFVLLWNMGITLLDQSAYPGVMNYVVTITSIPIFSLANPFIIFGSYGLTEGVFFFLLPYFQKSSQAIFGDYVITCVAILLSCAALLFIYRSRISDFNNRMIIQEKNDELKKLYEKLQKVNEDLEIQAWTDSVTGLYNRLKFDQLYMGAWEDALNKKSFLTIIMIDIDYFKKFNDTYGHPAGDDCLKKVGEVILEAIDEKTSFAARFGGEEFIVAISKIAGEEALQKAEQIRSKVEAQTVTHRNSDIKDGITISLGVYTGIPGEGLSGKDFIDRADSALYRAKREGRNRVKKWKKGKMI